MQYIRNAWYMAGWDKDFVIVTPKGMTILGEPIVLYRTDDDAIVALEDRCAHRLAPLSLGRCEGSNIRCMYHGLLFGPDGQCLQVPGQAAPPRAARVRAYPVIERHSAIWIWMGDVEAADPELIPDFKGYRHPDWVLIPVQTDFDVPAKLIHDNLLDLSHVGFVHRGTFGAGNPHPERGWVGGYVREYTLPRGVRVERWMENLPSTPMGGANVLTDRSPADLFTYYEFLVPGIFLQYAGRYPAGTFNRLGGAAPDIEPMFSMFTCQAVTPLAEKQSRYFFAQGPDKRYPSESQFFTDIAAAAFEEDRAMIEAQYRIIKADPSVSMMPMAMDKAVMKFAAVVKRLAAKEGERPTTMVG